MATLQTEAEDKNCGAQIAISSVTETAVDIHPLVCGMNIDCLMKENRTSSRFEFPLGHSSFE